jgi:hypothetical protein
MISVSVDKSTLTSDLNVDAPVVVTVTSAMGFTGPVTLAVAAADSTNAPISDWTTSLDSTTLTVPADGTATANLKLSAQGDAAELAGTLTITATPGDTTVTPANATVAVTLNPVLDITFADDGNGNCVYPAGHLGANNPYKLKAGRTISVYNGSANLGMVVHVDPGVANFPHESTSAPGTLAGQAYTRQNVGNPGDQATFYCHAGVNNTMNSGSNPYPQLQIVQ